jgi:hypothetical protein
MGKSGVEKNALANSGAAVNQATSAYNTSNPIYSQMATNPQGYTPEQKGNLLTASAEALGGGQSAAVGAGSLLAARTGNAGGATAAIDDAARQAGVQSSQNALSVENQDAQLADSHQREGLAGLNGIYDDANKTGGDYLNTAEDASKNSFGKMLAMGALSSAGFAGGSYLGRK